MKNDLISRSALLELYADTPQINFAVYNVPVPVVRQNIIDMPAIEAEPVRHGRWIDDRTDIVCSECKAAYSDEIVFMNRDLEYNNPPYCPNCGAKMDKEE